MILRALYLVLHKSLYHHFEGGSKRIAAEMLREEQKNMTIKLSNIFAIIGYLSFIR